MQKTNCSRGHPSIGLGGGTDDTVTAYESIAESWGGRGLAERGLDFPIFGNRKSHDPDDGQILSRGESTARHVLCSTLKSLEMRSRL